MSHPHSCSTASITSFNITPSSASSSSPSPSKRSLFVRRLIRTLVLLFVFLKVISFIAWRVLNPTPPVFELNSFNISDTNYTTAFTITNPNKKLTLLLDKFEVVMFQGNRKNVASRDQWMPTDKSLCLNNNAMVFFSVKGRVFKKISFLGNNFNVQVSLRTKFLAWNWLDLSLRFLSEKRTGNYSGEKGKCSVQVV
ncbi:hypothetical protein ES319_A09G102900v1 [Gossypium barbadense]|uniref:Late embryogenesis abundant protein LEA-2 subgroup domain-containing protein n=2 Tax=Gossypium TaxID=3633 RepID=A0A5J5UD17_GOSBA|nr:hypothetical protein ES319_A09G102900v1 [Gossypium barbadense]TYH02232.1 hypothetical protein ES288_A09G123100v1 [Gossypium darwinii]